MSKDPLDMRAMGYKLVNGKWSKKLSPKASFEFEFTLMRYEEYLRNGITPQSAWELAAKDADKATKKKFSKAKK